MRDRQRVSAAHVLLLALSISFARSAAAGDPASPPGIPAGACCLSDGGCRNASGEAECTGLGGVFLPDVECLDAPCGAGACCFELSCAQADAFSCISAGREFAGAGTSCLDDPCEAGVGACCIGAACLDLSPEDCAAMGATWLGAGTSCATDPCVSGACCLGEACIENAGYECDDLGGSFIAGAACAADPCAKPSDCPPDTLFGQSPDDPDGFTAGTSDHDSDFRRWEDFGGVVGAVDAVTWWGLDLEFVGGGQFIECEELNPRFTITFHDDAGGVPGAEVCAYDLEATRTPLGILYLGAELNEYRVVLPAECTIVNGWVSITGLGGADCWFLWMSAGVGDSYCEGCLPAEQDIDLSVCLQGTAGGVFGACCNDSTGACEEDVEIVDCAAPGQRFVPNADCSEIDPPCGTILGACCFADATCSIEEEAACGAASGTWLGADTICSSCPCITPCPDGGTSEGEPICEDGYTDLFNGGCTSPAPAFSSLALGETVCGESGVFVLDSENVPDFDWYAITVPRSAEVSWTVQAEFRPRSWIVDASEGCPGLVLTTAEAFECDELTITAQLPAGVHWFVVAPAGFTDSAACGARYKARADVMTICAADVDGDGQVGFDDLLDILSAWGPCVACPQDVTEDGVIGFDDLLAVLMRGVHAGRRSR